jgi:SAM-dependent methyltransferase
MESEILVQLNTDIKNNLIQHFTITPDKRLIPEQSYTVNSFLKSGILNNTLGKRVLDIGCNIGQFSFFAKQAGAKYVLGIDIIKNREFIDLANRIKNFLNLDVNFKCIDVSDDLLLEGRFDIILCMSVYHYMYHQYRSHDKIFKIFSQMCNEVYWENPWGMEDKSCSKLFNVGMPEEIPNYTKEKILEAASTYFNYKYLGLHGGKTRHTLYMRKK